MMEMNILPSHGTDRGERLHPLRLQYTKKGAHNALEVLIGCS